MELEEKKDESTEKTQETKAAKIKAKKEKKEKVRGETCCEVLKIKIFWNFFLIIFQLSQDLNFHVFINLMSLKNFFTDGPKGLTSSSKNLYFELLLGRTAAFVA